MEESRKPARSVRLQDFSTSLAHRFGKSELLLGLVFLLPLPLPQSLGSRRCVGYCAFVRTPLIELSLDFTHDYQHANTSFRDERVDEAGQPNP